MNSQSLRTFFCKLAATAISSCAEKRDQVMHRALKITCSCLLLFISIPVDAAASSPFPEDQRVFVEMLARCSQRVNQSGNPIQREIAAEECSNNEKNWLAQNAEIRDWNGVIRELFKHGAGDIVVVVSTTYRDLAAPATKTPLGTFVRSSVPVIDYSAQGTLVDKGSSVYYQLASLNIGDSVTFSGDVKGLFRGFGSGNQTVKIKFTDIRSLKSPQTHSVSPKATVGKPTLPQNANFQTSFDCKKAASHVEKTICSDEDLARIDVQVASVYQDVLRQASDPASLRSSQNQWLASKRNVCKDADCIATAYRQRVKELIKVPRKVQN